jgi:hypothetical protein
VGIGDRIDEIDLNDVIGVCKVNTVINVNWVNNVMMVLSRKFRSQLPAVKAWCSSDFFSSFSAASLRS